MTPAPTPGSDEAVKSGCTCPVLDNARGAGLTIRGERKFWIRSDCTLHGQPLPAVWPSVAGGSGAAVSHGGEDG